MSPRNTPSTEVATVDGTVARKPLQVIAPLPAQLDGLIVLQEWHDSLMYRDPYSEPDPEYLSRMLLSQTLTAESADAVMAQSGIRKLQEAIPNVPGAGTGPVAITDLYVTGSDFGEGAPCYMILTAIDLETEFETKYSTGAQMLQAQVLRLLALGNWPIRCNIKRLDRKDKGGRFLFWMFPPD
jgi:hypothetical protein